MKRSWPKAVWFWIIRGTAGSIAAVAVVVALLPLPPSLFAPASGTLLLLDAKGRELAMVRTDFARVQIPVTLPRMGAWLPAVTVALEDHRFGAHPGVDPIALAGAASRNLASGKIRAGASTISQQLIKLANLEGKPARARIWRDKLFENLAALRLSATWDRSRILEAYLNRLDYGNQRIGPEAAARSYFGKAAFDLSLAESVFLAGLPQAPSAFNPWKRPEAALARYHRALDRLRELGAMDEGTFAALSAAPPKVLPYKPPNRRAPHFVEAVLAQLSAASSGAVATTLDLDLQNAVESMVKDHLATLEKSRASQAAVVVIHHDTGSVRAMVGSAGFDRAEGQVNGALLARSSGSTLKPFIYLQAIESRKLTAATLLPDTPDAIRSIYPDYDPANYDRRFQGPVRVRQALASSLNVPAVVALDRVGPREAFDRLCEWGFRFPHTFQRYGAGLAIGNGEIRLIDLVTAFGALVRGGEGVHDRMLMGARPARWRMCSPESAAIITDILCDNEARRSTFGLHSPLAFPFRIPVKTGTSSGFRDTWCVGSTRQHTVGVWVGNFDGRPMDQVASSMGAAPLWRAVIHFLLREDLPLPDPRDGSLSLEGVRVCAFTGKLPTRKSPAIIDEWFLPGTKPAQDASEILTPEGVILPPEYSLWCRSAFNQAGATVRSAEFAILQPADGSRYTLSPSLPRSQQQIPVVTNLPVPNPSWFLDGQPLEATRGSYYLPLLPGRHVLELRSPSPIVSSHFSVD
jgi:penicillin-binding protein 1C